MTVIKIRTVRLLLHPFLHFLCYLAHRTHKYLSFNVKNQNMSTHLNIMMYLNQTKLDQTIQTRMKLKLHLIKVHQVYITY